MKIKGIPSGISASPLFLLLPALLLLTPSCVCDSYDAVPQTSDGMAVELSIMTRAISSSTQTYEAGSTWENYIDIAGGDYRIYFFTNDKDDATATSDAERNTLIAEFQPTEMTAVEGTTYTQYTLAGEVGDDIAAYSDFKVVVLANWGTYPSVTAGTTTIDALVEGTNTTFSADTFSNGVNETHLIPFFGVQEYSDVTWKKGWRTTLSDDITLLRAVAKVEVVMSEDSDSTVFDDVSILRYNSEGYCAPKGVYLSTDYNHGSWEKDFVDDLHLVGNANDSAYKTMEMLKTEADEAAGTPETWTCYLPEYDNTSSSSGYSRIQIHIDGYEYVIHFSNYEDGVSDSDADYDIYRNYLYRFVVTYNAVAHEVYANLDLDVINQTEGYFDNWTDFEL